MEAKPKNKVEAIYQMRDAVEVKVEAEHALAANPSPEARDALLEAQLELESKTQDAIESCHECGHAHAPGRSHANALRARENVGNVVNVDFRPGAP